MTRLPKSPLATAFTSSRRQRWAQLLRVAIHLSEHRERLQPSIGERNLATIGASLAAESACTPDSANNATIAAAVALVTRTPWLFAPWLLPAWRRIIGLLEGVDRRKSLISFVLVAGLTVALVGIYFVRSHSYAHWQSVVTPLAGDAALMQQKVGVVIRSATHVGTVQLGASVHAEGALIEINKLNSIMRGLIVASTDPAILQQTFAEHPDAKQVVVHDRNVLRLVRQHLQLAHDELDKAERVLSYGKKWHDLDPYAAQPAGLSSQWLSEAIAMRSALNSGDMQKIEQADLRLDTLRSGGEIARKAESVAGNFSADDRAMAAPYVSIIEGAVIHGDLVKGEAALATLTMLQKQVPLSYSLYVLSIPGETTFVIKEDARDKLVKHHYLIVQATNEHGAQVPVDMHDSELNKDVAASRFGIEVSAETFGQAQSAERDGLLLVGKKSSGTVSTVFALPVLDGRISRW